MTQGHNGLLKHWCDPKCEVCNSFPWRRFFSHVSLWKVPTFSVFRQVFTLWTTWMKVEWPGVGYFCPALHHNQFFQLHFHFSHQLTTGISINMTKYPQYVPDQLQNLIWHISGIYQFPKFQENPLITIFNYFLKQVPLMPSNLHHKN